MFWNFHISIGDIYNGIDFILTEHIIRVRVNSFKPLTTLFLYIIIIKHAF